MLCVCAGEDRSAEPARALTTGAEFQGLQLQGGQSKAASLPAVLN